MTLRLRNIRRSLPKYQGSESEQDCITGGLAIAFVFPYTEGTGSIRSKSAHARVRWGEWAFTGIEEPHRSLTHPEDALDAALLRPRRLRLVCNSFTGRNLAGRSIRWEVHGLRCKTVWRISTRRAIWVNAPGLGSLSLAKSQNSPERHECSHLTEGNATWTVLRYPAWCRAAGTRRLSCGAGARSAAVVPTGRCVPE
jgi:hypothetical protein